MIAAARKEGTAQAWAMAALAVALFYWGLAVFDTVHWHPGYAWGDETDIISYLQRAREGMPMAWMPGFGSLHKALLLACMEIWPGRLWTSSVPALLGLGLEAWLLYKVAARWHSSKAAFFAVLVAMSAAFTLIRARISTSFSLFPAEWLFLLWLRPHASKPWQQALWGGLLGLFCFDYEAWLPSALLFLLLPIEGWSSWRRVGVEALGCLLLVAALLSPEQARLYLERRRAGSFLNSLAPSAGSNGVAQLLFGGPCLPYFAPRGHGTLPLWECLALPAGFWVWGRNAWRPLLYAALGIGLTLAGGAHYGTPTHRIIAAWPVLALLAGAGLERIWELLEGAEKRALFAGVLALCVGYQGWVWASVQSAYDVPYRGPVRDLQRAAKAGVELSRSSGLPFVTELHAIKGPELRFLAGIDLPLPLSGSTRVVAYLPWEYSPGPVQGATERRSFREGAYGPLEVGILSGAAAAQALEAERELRPCFLKKMMGSLDSARASAQWLREHPQAGPWARTLGQDFLGTVLNGSGRVGFAWVQSLEKEPLISVRPLIVALVALGNDPLTALPIARRARRLDPKDARVRRLEDEILGQLGKKEERLRLEREAGELDARGLLNAE